MTKKLTLQEKVFLAEIYSLDNKDGCYASNNWFARFFNVTPQRCSQIINGLIKKEVIKAEYIKNKKAIEKRVLRIFDRGIKDIYEGYKEYLQGYQGSFKVYNKGNNKEEDNNDASSKKQKTQEGKKPMTQYQQVIDKYYDLYRARNDGIKPTINGQVGKLIKADLRRFKDTKWETVGDKVLCDALELYNKEDDQKCADFIAKAGFSYSTFHGMLNYILDHYSFEEFLDGGNKDKQEG